MQISVSGYGMPLFYGENSSSVGFRTFPNLSNSHIKEVIVKICVSCLYYTIDIKHKCFVNKKHSSQWILPIWDCSAC